MSVWTSDKSNRTFLLEKAVEAWSGIADKLKIGDENWVYANWLRIDLKRQLGAFKQADYWLRDFEGKTGLSYAPVTTVMISLERQLIAAQDPRPTAVPFVRSSPR